MELIEILEVKAQMENLRSKLDLIVSNKYNNGTDENVVTLSQELDILINKYMNINKK